MKIILNNVKLFIVFTPQKIDNFAMLLYIDACMLATEDDY